MRGEVTLGWDEEIGVGRDVTPPPDPVGALVRWTREVEALELAHTLLPDTNPLIDDEMRTCALSCDSEERASEVYRYLENRAEELNIIPDLAREEPLVYIIWHTFDNP